MTETVAPVVPSLVLVLGCTAFVHWVVLFVSAAAILIRSDGLSTGARVIWIVAFVALPLAGCFAWLVYYAPRRAAAPCATPR